MSESISIHALREEGDRAAIAYNVRYARFLSTPSARRATTEALIDRMTPRISIHALREEGDQGDPEHPRPQHISIHALREEGDFARCRCPARAKNFYPRPPRGGRPDGGIWKLEAKKFLSTPSARRATYTVQIVHVGAVISIHALREEGDSFLFVGKIKHKYFYPRPPRGGRPVSAAILLTRT